MIQWSRNWGGGGGGGGGDLGPPPLFRFNLIHNTLYMHSYNSHHISIFPCTSLYQIINENMTIDNIDYITGIGNSSCEQYIRAGNPCRLDLQEKPQKCTKKSQIWPKIMHFSNTFENIYQTETLRSLKLGYPSGQGLL